MKKLVLAVSFAACAASPALAQSKTPMQNIEEGRRNERLDTDRQYEQQRRIRAVPDADVKVDPWAVVRGAEDRKSTRLNSSH